MLKVALIISQPGLPTQEVESGQDVLSVGSALDNTVCLEEDAGVARYHAVIERRGETFWLSDLGSREGTTVNGSPVVTDRELRDGDRIALGEACVVEFYRHEVAAPRAADHPDPSDHSTGRGLGAEVGSAASSAASSAATAGAGAAAPHGSNAQAAGHAVAHPADPPAAGVSPSVKVGAGVLGGLLLTGAAAAILFGGSGGGCRPTARILSPVNGSALRSAAPVRLELGEAQCIRRVSYQLDGEEVASASAAPFEATLDPRRLTRFAPGNHVLTATIETEGGEQLRQPGEVYLALGAAQEPAAAATPAPESTPPPAAGVSNAPPVSADVQAMAERLASQISGKSGYVFEREMTIRIQSRTSEFAAANAPARAAPYRRVVVKSFSDHGVKPFLGFVLAMSRSKFDAAPSEGGPWRVPAGVAQAYLQAGETPRALEDPRRAAEVSAVYLKHLLGVFESENFDLAVACYGCTMEEAGTLKQRLSAVPDSERRNFWSLFERGLVSQEQAERVVRFYAAGIVGENPQRFGASDDRRLSALEY
ncbi:MAG TPA: FHA domain-containing protein [Pyrinomonadaceae bacterium]|jgi:predicted component of type VI protein secretion system